MCLFYHVEEKENFDPSGKKEYLKTCELLGIIPVSHFIRCLQAGDATIDLSHHNIGAKGTKALVPTLTVCKHL